MSGHSKWATTKHKKAVVDARRGKLFARLIKNIEVAARQGGGDPAGNPTLYDAIQKARKSSVPLDNIERAVKRGSGAEAGGADIQALVIHDKNLGDNTTRGSPDAAQESGELIVHFAVDEVAAADQLFCPPALVKNGNVTVRQAHVVDVLLVNGTQNFIVAKPGTDVRFNVLLDFGFMAVSRGGSLNAKDEEGGDGK